MAVYTTFFAAQPSELAGALPGWRQPLPSPVKRTRVNPFTRQPQTYESWEPEHIEPRPTPLANPRVIEMRGDYPTYLRERLPAGMRTWPHFPTKGVLSPHVAQLLALVGGRAEERLVPALFPPGGSASGTTLDVLPAWAIDTLADVQRDAIPSLSKQLATAKGWFADEGWGVEGCAGLLEGLHALAFKARDGVRRLYLLTEA
jgi:hypothetical protein